MGVNNFVLKGGMVLGDSELTAKMLSLVSDGNFQKLKGLSEVPNFFRIVGRTHTETWHSMFLGWLLDPKGSHGLGDFPLKRFLLSLFYSKLGRENVDRDYLGQVVALSDLSELDVYPNEREQKEYKISDEKRLDVFVDGKTSDDSAISMVVEQKVGAKIDSIQCRAYADWLYGSYKQGVDRGKIAVLLVPEDRMSSDLEKTTGDDRWVVMSYQSLHDDVLVPCLNSSSLHSLAEPILRQYVEGLRTTVGGRKLAVTEEEIDLARKIYEEHADALKAIAESIQDEGIQSLEGRPAKIDLRLKVLDGKGNLLGEVEGGNVKEFFESFMEFVSSTERNIFSGIPYRTGTKRYLISTSPKHPEGNEFKNSVKYGSYFMEANKSRTSAVLDVTKFLEDSGLEVEKHAS